MANRYANLVGSNKIKDEYQKINQGFDAVQADMDEKADADDLVNLENVVNSHIGSGGNAHAAATTTEAGFMSASDKEKLDGIEAGAQVNQNAFAQVNDLEAADPSDELIFEGGTGITITTTPEEKKIRITATGEATPGPHGSEHNHDGADPIPDLVQLRSLGLGIDVDPRLSADLNNEINTGWVRFETGETLNRPSDEIPGFPHSGVVRVDRRNNSRLAQTAYGVAGATSVRIAVRALGSTGWGDWVEILHTGNTGNLVEQDWEVGSFSPLFTTSENPIQSITYDSSGTSGSYVKIANLVYIRLNIQTQSVQKGNASGDLRIAGLPFPFGTGAGPQFAGFNIARILNFDQIVDQSYPLWKIGMPPNSNYLVIFNHPPSASSATVAGPEILRDHSSGTFNRIAITGMYYTSL